MTLKLRRLTPKFENVGNDSLHVKKTSADLHLFQDLFYDATPFSHCLAKGKNEAACRVQANKLESCIHFMCNIPGEFMRDNDPRCFKQFFDKLQETNESII